MTGFNLNEVFETNNFVKKYGTGAIKGRWFELRKKGWTKVNCLDHINCCVGMGIKEAFKFELLSKEAIEELYKFF